MSRAAIAFATFLPLAAHAGLVRIPGDASPKSLAALGSIDAVLAVAVSEDGSLAAAGFLDPGRDQASFVRLADAGAARGEIEVKGKVRALAFDGDGTELFVIAERRAKRAPGETFLVRVDTSTLKSIREIILPRDARDLTLKSDGSLLVASDGELRTFLLPAFTSGPLYRLDGVNRAIAVVPGTRQVVVGREDGLWLVDLGDPQTRDGLPVRERVATPGPVAEIVMSSDGRHGWARLTDRNVVRFRLDPLRMEEADGTAAWIGWVAEEGEEPPAPPPPAPPPPPPPPAPVVVEPPMPAPIQGGSPPAPIVPHEARMEGRITGPAGAAVVAVVVLGPDNILREAARVSPDGNGYWWVGDLAPGTYRVLLDGGGGRVLETTPPFRTVVVGPEGTAGVEPIEAVRIR